MTHETFDTTDFVVIERGPLRGVDPTTTFHPNRASAFTYVESRRGLFEHIDVGRIITRVSVTLVPQETVEGEGLR